MAKVKEKEKENGLNHSETYDASKITVLEGLEAVRKRPGMYIGSTDVRGLHHLVFEVVDNAIDEALAGDCDHILVTIHKDNSVTVDDNGRGIPVDTHTQTGRSALEVVMTKLHAGAKFGQGGYKVASGLHGVGVSAVNALSEWLNVRVRRDGQVYEQKYARGVPKKDVQAVGKYPKDQRTGTIISFMADKQIFKQIDYKFDVLAQRFREMAFLTRGLTITFRDERDGREMAFYFEGGVTSFVRYLNKNRTVLHPPFTVAREVNGSQVEVAIQYTDSYGESVYTFANNINTVDGGTHLTGFRTALTRTLNDYARKNNLLKENDPNLTGDDVREGLTAIVSVKLQDPQFESQTKGKLGNAEIKTQVESVVAESFSGFLEENTREARAIVDKCVTTARAREAARHARDLVIRKSALESLSLPGKLADCSERDTEKAELYIVEGDSAGGCLAGETAVPLTSGITKTMRELAEDWERGIQHFGYATNSEGEIRIVLLLEPHLTKRASALVQVVLDNGQRIRCTADHPFRLRDGSYRAASELGVGDSLMPFKTRLTREDELPGPGYEMVWMNGRGEWWQAHPEHREKIVAARQRGWADPNQRMRILSALTQWRESTPSGEKGTRIREGHRMKALGLLHRVLAAGNVREAYERIRRQSARTALGYDRLLEEYFAGDEGQMLEAAANINCKVVSVEMLPDRADVYDLTVEGYHNFALASGVFVHNSAKQGRDRRFQAILPLRGKIMNVEKARLDKMLQNEEIRAMITAIGTGVGTNFDLKTLRYGRVVIMTDADQDGEHIRTLLLTFFYRHMPGLIEHGHLFIAQPPLYRVKDGKTQQYLFDDKELEALRKKIKGGRLEIQRYKGLGEMNPDQLWETTMNPANRTLLQVNLEDATEADRTFEMLMGNDVAPRKRFIQTHAKSVRNLDV